MQKSEKEINNLCIKVIHKGVNCVDVCLYFRFINSGPVNLKPSNDKGLVDFPQAVITCG